MWFAWSKMPRKKKKTLQALKEIGEEYGSKSSVHGLSYVADPLLPLCERILWFFLFLGGLGLAVYLNVSSYIAWRENMVVINLRSTGRPVSELDFPTVTICASGLHMDNVEEALKEDFIKWREEKGRTEIDNIDEELAEYMEEIYQITNPEVNILDILNTMIAPNNAEDSLGANGARENFAACNEKEEENDLDEGVNKMRKRDVFSESENYVEYLEEIDISEESKSIGSLRSFDKKFNISFDFFPGELSIPAETDHKYCFLSLHTEESIRNGMKDPAMQFAFFGENLVGRFDPGYIVDNDNIQYK